MEDKTKSKFIEEAKQSLTELATKTLSEQEIKSVLNYTGDGVNLGNLIVYSIQEYLTNVIAKSTDEKFTELLLDLSIRFVNFTQTQEGLKAVAEFAKKLWMPTKEELEEAKNKLNIIIQ